MTIRTEFISLEQLNKESRNQLPNEDAVAAAVEGAHTHLPATQDSQLLTTAAEALLTASEPPGLANVIDYVEKILNIGDVVAEVGCLYLLRLSLWTQRYFQVHPYAKAAWMVLSLIPKVSQAHRFNTFY